MHDPAIRERNLTLVSGLSRALLADFLCYLRYRFGQDAEYRIDGTTPEIVATYLAGRNRGKWADLERNQRCRDYGYTAALVQPQRRVIPSEDITSMMNRVSFEARIHPDAQEARSRFAEATRSAAFSLALGIREIRLLAKQPWGDTHWLTPTELAALHKLIDRGLLVHTPGTRPRLSEAGELVRQLLVLSNHIVDPG